jgi:hypothetical protein
MVFIKTISLTKCQSECSGSNPVLMGIKRTSYRCLERAFNPGKDGRLGGAKPLNPHSNADDCYGHGSYYSKGNNFGKGVDFIEA